MHMNPDFLNLQTRKNFFTGTHRSRPPETTLAEYGALMPMMGITRLANITGLDRIGLPVCIAVRPNSRTLATSQGKGETIAAAKASAMMESIEGWHAERIAGPILYESYHALADRLPVIDVSALAVRVDATFYADRPIHWIEGLDLMTRQSVWVPFESVSLNLVKQPGHKPIFLESSNGLSSGNQMIEAIIHALCEVIERDAVTLWAHIPVARKKERQIDLATVSDPSLRRIIDQLATNGIVLGAWDITSDIGLPTFTCTCVEDPDSPDWRPVTTSDGHGSHLVPEIALSRAIHEAIQARLTFISGSRDDIFPADYIKHGNRDDHVAIAGAIKQPPASLSFAPNRLPVSDFFEEDLETILSLLRNVGINCAAVVDLTRAEVGIPVVKLVVPGLEPFHTPVYQPGKRAQRLQMALGL
jgi:YcaO-like protein with predicted kinase domain